MKHQHWQKFLYLTACLVGGLCFADDAPIEFSAPGLTPAPNGFVWTSDGKRLVSNAIPVDTARDYVLTGEFKPIGEVKEFTFGLELLNDARRVIPQHAVCAVAGTETKLLQGTKPGDTSIVVADASKWKISNGRVIALWVKPELRDLPAKAFAYYIKSIEKGDDGWRIEFTRPLIYKAQPGILVRQHSDTMPFSAVYRRKLGEKRSVRHLIESGGKYFRDSRCWWPGVRFARVFVQAPAGSKIECARIALRPVAGSELETLRKERAAKPSTGLAEPPGIRVGDLIWPKSAVKPTGKSSFSWTSDGKRLRSAAFEIDHSRYYLLSGEFTAESGVGKFTFGVDMQEKNGRFISPHSVRAVAGTETKLVRDAKKGDSGITVEDASNWKIANGRVVAMWVQPELRDLPARNFAFYIKSIKKADDGWRIEFTRPLLHNVPAGKLVRQHSDAAGFNAAYNIKLDDRTRTFRHLIAPGQTYTIDSRCWWPGAHFARVYLQAPAGSKIECRNVTLRPLSDAEAAEMLKQQKARGANIRPFGGSCFTGFDKEITAAPGSGFYVSGLSWPVDRTRQIELRIKSSQAGMLELVYSGSDDSGKGFWAADSQPVTPDGEYHWRIYNVELPENTAGNIKTLRMTWRSNLPTELDVTNIGSSEVTNLVPGADKLGPGKKIMLDYVLPRRKYDLKWVGGNNPGVKFSSLDRDGKVLETFRLPSGKSEAEIAMPAMAVRAELSVDGSAAGRPVLSPVSEPSALSWRGRWIWSQKESGPEWTNVWFEREFDISGPVEAAALAVAADDHPTIWINGEAVGSGGSYVEANCFDVTKFLRPGKNTVVIRVLNGVQNGGLLCDIYYRADGKDNYVCSGPEWKLHVGGKKKPEKIDSPVVVVGGVPDKTAPWAGRLDYRYAGPRNVWKVLSTSENSFAAEVLKDVVEMPRFIRAKAVSEDGSVRQLMLDAKVTKSSGKITVSYPSLFSTSDKPQTLYLADDYVTVADNAPVGVIPPSHPAGFAKAQFVDVGGRPKLILDGREYDPAFWAFNTSIRANPIGQTALIAEARDAGFRNFSLLIDFPDFWLGPDKYDFSKLDIRAGVVLDLCPDAIFLLQVGCWMPEWWLKANPDDVTAHANGSPLGALESQALSSKKWLHDAEAPLKALVEHLRKRSYSRKIWGVSVSENRNWEWFWTTRDRNGNYAVSGYSPGDLAAFRAMLRRKYESNEKLAAAWKDPRVTFDTAQMPPSEEHGKGSVGLLLDPERDRRLMDWFEYRNLALAEAVIHLCRTLKTASGGNWLAGAYYGYFVEMAVNRGRPVHDHGHNGYLETAKSPEVDFVRAPSRYDLRKIGLPDGIMHAQDTYTLRGKVVYIECDHRTAYRKMPGAVGNYVAHPATGNETVAVLNRAFGMMLASGVAHYWYDITRGAFREPVLNDLLREQNELYMKLPPVHGLTPREVAVVVDRDSAYYTKRNSYSSPNGVMPTMFGRLFWNFNRLGAPYRVMSVDDLLDGLAPASRFYIMTDMFSLSRERRDKLMARFDAEKATVLWLYAPGAFYPDRGPRAEFCGDFLGLRVSMSEKVEAPMLKTVPPLPRCKDTVDDASAPWFYPESGYDEVLGRDAKARPVLVSFKRGGANHIFSTLPALPVELLRYFAAKAGAHLYTPDATDQLWIGNDVLFIHTVKGGKKHFILPAGTRLKGILGPMKGKELVSGEQWEAEAGQTCGFLLTR